MFFSLLRSVRVFLSTFARLLVHRLLSLLHKTLTSIMEALLTMASFEFSVTKSEGSLVLPSAPTPTHTLPLSWFDKVPMAASFMEMFFVYKQGQESAEVIKQALSKTLVPYYPLAGRIVRSDHGAVMHVACTGDGVWLVDATADISLEDLGWLESPPFIIPRDELLPSHPNPVGMSILLQVTKFKCGGFVVGLLYDHIMADGIGIAQIMKAIGDIARGLEHPVIKPVWLREHIPNPPFPQISMPPMPTVHLEHLIVDIPQSHINQIKGQYFEQTSRRCSSLDVAIAQLWQCRIRAIGLDPTVKVYLGMPANTRNLGSHLPKEGGYYGNCIYPMTLSALSGKVAQGSVIEVVGLIRDAKKRLPEEFAKWAKGEHEPYAAVVSMVGYDSMGVTDWSGLGFSDIDYGWGGPVYFSPVPPPPELIVPPLCIAVKPPVPKEGCRMITRVVAKEHFEAFYDQLMSFSTSVKIEGIN